MVSVAFIAMVKSCQKPLKTNPFATYRDPKTGKWLVVKATA